jgi:sporulation protein YlmC with PRC-barrel domain
MLKQLLTATALVTVASVANAATPTTSAPATSAMTAPATAGQVFMTTATAQDHFASKLIGTDVYDGTAINAQSIGKISDLVVGPGGAINAVVIGVGGFLGVGQKNVAVSYSNLQWGAHEGKPVLIAAVSKDDLQNAPSFDTAAIDQRDQTLQTQAAQQMQNSVNPLPVPGTVPAANSNAAANNTPASATQAMPNSNATTALLDTSKISAQDLMGTTVYSTRDRDIGSVGDVVLTKDGKIDAIVIDVGGFLGIGQKPVAIAYDGLDIRKDADGKLAVYTHFTRNRLENAPKYDKNGYTAARDTMRLTNPS